jgi:hypothetical protein
MKAATSNGSGSKVLHRVISLTTANHNDSNNYAKPAKPSFIPEKLQFSAYEKFEGEHTHFNGREKAYRKRNEMIRGRAAAKNIVIDS